MDSPFFVSTRFTAIRSAAGSSAIVSASEPASEPASDPAPTGTRTRNGSPGGVVPRRICGFKSLRSAIDAPTVVAMTAMEVSGGTVTESYANGGAESTVMP